MGLYVRHFGLWLLLAGTLVVPFEIVLQVVTSNLHGGTLTAHQSQQLLLFILVDFVVVIPVVSALQARAVALLGEGERPDLRRILRLSLPVMPTVIAASIIAGIGVTIGLVVFILPGIWVLLRLYVVAQTAAIEGTDWPTTLRRSYLLTHRNFWRVFSVLVIVGLINLVVELLAASLSGSGGSTVQDIVAGAAALVSQSFSTLLTAVLYFDLRARRVHGGAGRRGRT